MARDLGGFVTDWEQLHRLAGQIRPMVGISEDAWAVAQQRLGPQVAAAALALIFDKFNAGEVALPRRLSARHGRKSRGRGAASGS